MVLWLHLCCKLMKRFNQVDLGILGNIFFGFVAKVYCLGVRGGKTMRPFYSSPGIHLGEKEGMQIRNH